MASATSLYLIKGFMSNKKIVNLDEFIHELSSNILAEVLRVFDLEEDKFGPEFRNKLYGEFVATFVAQAVFGILHGTSQKYVDLTDKEKFDHVSSEFVKIKEVMQEAVSAGFQAAMTNYSGHVIEYYCNIKSLPSQVNKLPC